MRRAVCGLVKEEDGAAAAAEPLPLPNPGLAPSATEVKRWVNDIMKTSRHFGEEELDWFVCNKEDQSAIWQEEVAERRQAFALKTKDRCYGEKSPFNAAGWFYDLPREGECRTFQSILGLTRKRQKH